MPRRAKVDRPATEQAFAEGRFCDEDSFITQDSTLRLAGIDWHVQKMKCFERDNYTCVICHRKRDEESLDAHHIKPKGKGGSDDLSNLATICFWTLSDCHKNLHPEKQLRFSKSAQKA